MPTRRNADPQGAQPPGLLRRLAQALRPAPAEGGLPAAILDAVPDAVLVLDIDDRVRLANDAVEDVLGHAPQDLIGVAFADTLLPLGSRKAHRDRLGRALEGESPPARERRTVVTAQGGEVEVEMTVHPIEGPQPLVGVTLRDAGATHDLEAALDKTDARRRTLRTIVDAFPDPVVAVDHGGRVVLRNQAAQQIGDFPKSWWRDSRAVLARGEPAFDQEEPTASGVQLTTRVPVRDRAGTVIGLVVISRDVTDQKETETRLLASMEAAESAARANREFLATTSHEVRTLMSGVTGMTMLLQNTDLDDDQSEFVDTIRSSSSALLTVINDVLDYSKIESGRLDLEDEPFEVRALAAEAVRMVAQQASGKGLALEAEIDDGVPETVRGDAGRVRQVLVNLLSNAVKFTSEGGVTVRVHMVAGDRPGLAFAVRDTGVGIAADRLDAIFEEFTQAETSTARTHGGTGLGLAICRRLVGMMGGVLEAESAPGQGSEFRFTIALEGESAAPSEPAWIARPADACAAPAVERETPPAPSADEPHGVVIPMDDIVPMARVLLAEDNPVNQRVTKLTLQRLGYRPEVVDDGAQAVEAVRTGAYDVVLMDIMMPVMNGLEATAAIRKDWGPNPRPAIVALTANAMKGDRQNCLDAGCDDYLAKPVAPETLAATIERAIRERTAAVEA